MKSKLLIALSIAVGVSTANAQVALRWRTPLDFRTGDAGSTSGIRGLHLQPSGQISAISQRGDGTFSGQGQALYLTNINKNGTVAISKSLTQANLTSHSYADSFMDSSGRIYLASNTIPGGGRLARYGADGTELYRMNGLKPILGVVAEPFGNTYSIYGNYAFSGPYTFVEKRGLNGESKWSASFPIAMQGILSAKITLDGAGNIVVVGVTQHFNDPNTDIFVWKLNPAGATTYCRLVPNSLNWFMTRVAIDNQNNIIFSAGSDFYDYDKVVSIKGNDGALYWERSLTSIATDIAVDQNASVLVFYGFNEDKAILRAYSRGGSILWTKTPLDDPERLEAPSRMTLDTYGEIYLTGWLDDGKAFLVKTASNGTARYSTRWSQDGAALKGGQIAVHNATGDITIGDRVHPVETPNYPYAMVFGLQQAPLVKNDAFTVPKDQQSSPGSFTANDQFAQASGIVIVTQPAHGTLTWTQDGNFTYMPDAGYVGTDVFTYRLRKAELSSFAATVTLNVQ